MPALLVKLTKTRIISVRGIGVEQRAPRRKLGRMNRLNPQKLRIRFRGGSTPVAACVPRCYTLTHSDLTGELYLTIGPTFDRAQISGWYTRLMRDEVLANWEETEAELALHVHCHVKGGLVLGSAEWREAIFRRELPLVLEAFRFADRRLVEAQPELDRAPVWVHFHGGMSHADQAELWGTFGDYC